MNLLNFFPVVFSKIFFFTTTLFTVKSIPRKAVGLALVLSLLVLPNSAYAVSQLTAITSAVADFSSIPFHYFPRALNWLTNKNSSPQQETMANRLSRVSRIRITPFKLVGYLGETPTFSAAGWDANREIVHGAKFNWGSSDSDKSSIDEAGRAKFLQPGQTKIICRAGFVGDSSGAPAAAAW